MIQTGSHTGYPSRRQGHVTVLNHTSIFLHLPLLPASALDCCTALLQPSTHVCDKAFTGLQTGWLGCDRVVRGGFQRCVFQINIFSPPSLKTGLLPCTAMTLTRHCPNNVSFPTPSFDTKMLHCNALQSGCYNRVGDSKPMVLHPPQL